MLTYFLISNKISTFAPASVHVAVMLPEGKRKTMNRQEFQSSTGMKNKKLIKGGRVNTLSFLFEFFLSDGIGPVIDTPSEHPIRQ